MPRIEDNRARETISFDGSGTHRVHSWDPSPGEPSAGTVTVVTVARKTGVVVVLKQERTYSRGASGITFGAPDHAGSILSGILSGVDADVTDDGTAIAVDVSVNVLVAGEWTVTSTVIVEGETL